MANEFAKPVTSSRPSQSQAPDANNPTNDPLVLLTLLPLEGRHGKWVLGSWDLEHILDQMV